MLDECSRVLTRAGRPITVGPVTIRAEADKFLRAAVKTGLRLQRSGAAEPGEQGKNSGVRTLQRIKASLRRRTSNPKGNL